MPPADPNLPADPGKRKALKQLAALGLLSLLDLGALSSCGRGRFPSSTRERKLILLGIDGLDFGIATRLLSRGELPNFRRLQEMGGFRPLTSTIPPQSPVAWATVITGRDPGSHGIYDFVHRDPQNYSITPTIARTAPPRFTLPAGQYHLPLSSSQVSPMRRGPAFWDLLAEAGVPCQIHRVPSNFPPQDTGANQLSGLGTPDLRGSLGTCAFFSDLSLPAKGEIKPQQIRFVDGKAQARLSGPRNSLREGIPDTVVDFDICLDAPHKLVKIVIQSQQFILRQGEWSEWIPVNFTMVPHIKTVAGICRFYLKQISPHFQLYVTPINFDPMNPSLPIDAPPGFARQLAQRFGRFHTLGLPEDTGALSNGFLEDDEYLHQADLVFSETRRAWESLLDDFHRGLLFYYFGTTDRNQHMFWRAMDPNHPSYEAKLADKYGSVVEDCYRASDEIAGQALQACDRDTTLIVFSDHGFAPFYRRVNLNTWLAQKGYLAMRDSADGANLCQAADWSRTYAYALGLNSIYLNVKGREKNGTLAPEQRLPVARRLAAELRELRDPLTGAHPLANVYMSDDIYSEKQPELTPDLVVGYAPGFRLSSSAAVGVVTSEPIGPNEDKWSGDHCIDAPAVPGLLLANRPLKAARPALQDMAAAAIAEFGLQAPKEIAGNPVW